MPLFFLFFLLVLSSSPARSLLSAKGNCDHAPNKMLCLPVTYSKFELPYTESVNVVEIGIDISDVLRINDKEYSVTFSSYFNVLWKEPRLLIVDGFFKELNLSASASTVDMGLVTTSSEANSGGGDAPMVPVNLELVNDLWLPNIFIYNLQTFKVVEVLSKHAGLWITANNEVFYSQATHITFICPMRFDSFPLDTQSCKFQVGSYSYDDTKMVFLESPRVKGYVETSRAIVLDYDVHLAPLPMHDRMLNYGSLGNYSLAGFEMILHRYVSHYIITYYLPSGLFVVVSWISFVVPPDVIPGRMALLITLFLVLVNIFNSVTTNTPKAEGLTAIEAWMLACILFVFGALVEYAVILFRRQTCKDEKDRHLAHMPMSSYNNFHQRYQLQQQQQQSQPVHFRQPSQQQQLLIQQQQQPFQQSSQLLQQPSRPVCQQQQQQPQRVRIICQDNIHYEISQAAVLSPSSSPSQKPKHPPPPPPPRAAASASNNSSNSNSNNFHRSGSNLAERHSEAASLLNNEHSKRRQQQQQLQQQPVVLLEDEGKKRFDVCGENYLHVDRFFLVAMPMLFLVFNVVYWMSYGRHFFMEPVEEPTQKY